MWDLSIRDNTITLFGARLGMNLSDTLIFLNKCKYMNPVDPEEVDRIKQAKNGELCYEFFDVFTCKHSEIIPQPHGKKTGVYIAPEIVI